LGINISLMFDYLQTNYIFKAKYSALELRPRFRLSTTLSKDEIVLSLAEGIKNSNQDQLIGSWSHGHLVIYLPLKKRKTGSPHIDVSIEEHKNSDTILRCLMAPSPSIWTMFMFLYFAFGTTGMFGLMLGLSQWQLDQFPLALIVSPLLLVLYAIASQGQKLASGDMHLLRGFLTNHLKKYKEIPKEDW
jgi:hypothetical protein